MPELLIQVIQMVYAAKTALYPEPFSTGPAAFSARHRRAAVCSAVRTAMPAKQDPQNRLLFGLVENLFKIRPLFNMAVKQAREKIRKRGGAIGLDFDAEVAALQRATDWEAGRGRTLLRSNQPDDELNAVLDPSVAFPAYYTQPFHCYPEGNLEWEAALQVNVGAAAVHAPVMDPESTELDPSGDANLRRSYSQNMLRLMNEAASRPVSQAVDLGCSTGLSSLELSRTFPGTKITAIDLSPHFLAVASYLKRTQTDRPEWGNITLRHAAAEDTRVPGSSVDLVSCCLVMHELPQEATKAVIQEVFRILRPGGTLAIMEMDPASPKFQSIFRNPFAFAAFKSSEPWLLDYVSLDLRQLLRSCGFDVILESPCTPRHFALVAVKKC